MILIGDKVILLTTDLNEMLAVGELTFLGENKMLGWDLEAVVNRSPYQIESKDQIVEWSEELVMKYQYKKYE